MDKWFRNFLIVSGFSLLAAAILTLYLCLPRIAQKAIDTFWGADLAQYGIQFHMEEIAMSRALIRDVRAAGGFQVGSMEIFYGITRESGTGFRPVIKSLIISNLSIDPEKIRIHTGASPNKNGKSLQQLSSNQEANQEEDQEMDAAIQSVLALLPRKVTIKQGVLLVPAKYAPLHIPWDAAVNINPLDHKISCRAYTDMANQKLDMKINIQYHQKAFSGNLLVNLQSAKEHPSNNWLLPDISLAGTFGVSFHNNESPLPDIFFHGKTLPMENHSWTMGAARITLEKPRLLVDIESRKGQISTGIEFRSFQGEISKPNTSAQFSNLICTAGIHKKESAFFPWDMKVVSDRLSFDNERIQGKGKRLQVSANGRLTPSRSLSGKVSIFLETPRLMVPGSRIDIAKTAVELPFFIPLNKEEALPTLPRGSVSISNIRSSLAPKISLNLDAFLFQTKSQAISIEGRLICPNLTEPQFTFHGHVKNDSGQFSQNTAMPNPGPSARFDFSLPEFSLDSTAIKPLLPISLDLDMEGRASLSGSVRWDQHKGLASQGELTIIDTFIQNRDNTLEAKGINTTIQFDDLFSPSSLPGQNISIDSIKIGKLLFSNARMKCSLERTGAFLMENANVGWCDGIVSTEALRIPLSLEELTRKKMELTMYCDRLRLPLLLEQVGAFHSRGTGSVSGRIPVTWKDGFFSFDNGFLFSTPGTGGRILLKDTNKLLAGIPMGTPQFSQLDLAREALKEFDYEWVTLRLNSQKENLLLEMALNGKPSQALPFVYKKDLGRFIRVDSSNPGSHFQGIRLDVNLELPFHQAIKFGNTLLQKP